MDFPKAFDRAPYISLLRSLKKYCPVGPKAEILHSFLTSLTFTVSVGKAPTTGAGHFGSTLSLGYSADRLVSSWNVLAKEIVASARKSFLRNTRHSPAVDEIISR